MKCNLCCTVYNRDGGVPVCVSQRDYGGVWVGWDFGGRDITVFTEPK